MSEQNEAHDRIWNDDPVLTDVTPSNEVVSGRYSDEAMKILRDDGVEAYEQYVKDHS